MYGGSTVSAMGYPAGLDQLVSGAFGPPPNANFQGVNFSGGPSPGGMGAPPQSPMQSMLSMGNVPPELMSAIQAMQQQAQQRYAPPNANIGQPIIPEDSMNIGHTSLATLAPLGARGFNTNPTTQNMSGPEWLWNREQDRRPARQDGLDIELLLRKPAGRMEMLRDRGIRGFRT